MCNQARHQITHRRSISLAHRWVDFSFAAAAAAAGWEVWHWIWGRAQVSAPSIWVCVFFSLTISLEPCESIEKRKTKTKNERKDTVGSIRVSYRRFGELGILMMYYWFGFYFRVCTDTKFPCSVHNSLLLLSIPRFWSEFVVLFPQFLVC